MLQTLLFYLQLGWLHIISLDALDHQLFLLAILALYTLKDIKKIALLVTFFTLGHTITLVLSSIDFITISSRWVEFFIPLTIVFTSFFALISKNKPNFALHCIMVLLFGLIHGMGFANTASMLIAANDSIALPVFGFNIGVELGQLVIVAVISIISAVLCGVFRISRPTWVLFLSSGVFALSLKMTMERWPI